MLPQPHPSPEPPHPVLLEFNHRVELYTQWDRILASRTRFFGAAALINTALAELCVHPVARWLLSPSTAEFLTATGRNLQQLNTTLATRLQTWEIRADDLDHYMVLTEQNYMEDMLQSVRASDTARFSTVVSQLNRMLRLGGHSCVNPLAAICSQLPRPLNFACRDDRVHLGHSLIIHLRIRGSITPG